MKNLFFSIMFLVLATPIFAQTGTIVVNVSGIENNDGVIQIGLYNSETNFPDYESNFKGVAAKADKSGVIYTFTKIPVGTYAVAIWHDENEDKKMNKNLFGAPSENYGFSRNIYGSFGPPNFEEVSFELNSGKKMTLSINIE